MSGEIRRNANGEIVRGEIQRLAFEHFPDAYRDASAGGTVPAEARQLGYALRRRTRLGDDLDIDYVATSPADRSLLDKYLALHPEAHAWDVVRHPRGDFIEPNGETVPLGTIAVRQHLRTIGQPVSVKLPERMSVAAPFPRFGPGDDYDAVAYIEKEGFNALLAADGLPRHYDLALTSSKGFSVDAARHLLTWLASRDIPVFVAHDFDASGIGIVATIAREVPDAIDLGLRWNDVEVFEAAGDLDWMREAVTYRHDPRPTLIDHGATDDEIEFLCSGFDAERGLWTGHRVELNALVGSAFVSWLTERLDEHDVGKVVPATDIIVAAYRRAYAIERLNQLIAAAWPGLIADAVALEIDEGELVSLVTGALDEDETWRTVVEELAEEAASDDEGDDDEADDNDVADE